MNITIITSKLRGWVPVDVKNDIECKGSGTEAGPAILEPSENLPRSFRLKKSNASIVIQNCYLDSLMLNLCQNIVITNCNIWSLAILNCTEIFVNESTIRRTLHLVESNNIKIDDCTINRLKIRESNLNTIKFSTLKKIKFITGPNNVLEANEIPEKHLKRVRKKYWYGWYKLKII